LQKLEHLPQLAQRTRAVAGRSSFDARRSLLFAVTAVLTLLSLPTAVGFCAQAPPGESADASGPRPALEQAMRIADGDSAVSAILDALESNDDAPLAAEALLRAGFVAYAKGDAEKAHELFERAGRAGSSAAPLWDGLALLAAGRAADAAGVLRDFVGQAQGPDRESAELALAACGLALRDAGGGPEACERIVSSGGRYAVAAAFLMKERLGRGSREGGRRRDVRVPAVDDPLSYYAALAEVLRAGARGAEAEESAPDRPAETPQEPAAGEAVAPQEIRPGREAAAPRAGPAGEAEREGAGPTYSVQIGAFADVRNAEALVTRMVERGYADVRIERETRRGTLFHCVRVGRFRTREEALSLASELERKESLATTVLRAGS